MKLIEPKFSYKIESKRIYLRPILITEINDKYINFIKKAQNIIDIVNIDNIELNNIIKEFRQL